jgi:hypothetical protein
MVILGGASFPVRAALSPQDQLNIEIGQSDEGELMLQ